VPLASALCALALAPPALAQPGEPTRLPPVVVEREKLPPAERTQTEEQARQAIERVPGSVDLIGEKEITESRAINLQDVLEFTPGVLIRPRFGVADESQLSVRGSGLRNNFHLRGINLLIDGFPYGNADGFSDFESLELLAFKRIEVYKAANALRFGGNSLGGAINFVTKTGHDAGLFELRSEAGSFDFFKQYLGTGQVYGPFDLYVAATHTELDGYRDHSSQRRERLYSTFGYLLPGGTSLRLDLTYVRSDETLPGALTRREFRRDPRQADPTFEQQVAARDYNYVRGAFTLRTPLTEHQVLEWATQLNYQDLDHPLPFAVIDNTTYSWSSELRHIFTAPIFGLSQRLTTGLQYSGTRQIDVQLQNTLGQRGDETKNQINIASNFALYVEEQLDVTRALTAVLGGRAQYARRSVRDRFFDDGFGDIDANDSDDVDFFSVSPTAGFVWHVAPTVQVYGNATRTYEAPLLLELTAPGVLQGGLDELKAQKAWQFEVGTRGTVGDWLTWDVAVFDIELWDELQNVNVQPFPGAPFTIPRFRNIDRTRHTGVEVGAEVRVLEDIAPRLGLGTLGDQLKLRAAYTWSRFVFVDDPMFGDNDLPGAPPHFVRAELRYDHRSGFWVAPGVEAVPEGYFVNSENTVKTDPYALLLLRAGYTYAPWNLSVSFEARNLTDVRYVSSVQTDVGNGRYFEPGDGRAFYGGVQWRWK
jgi:iron complex outermembrane receptor protein